MGKIIGNTTATPNPRSDWNQNDATKADYIKNKPTVLTEDEIINLIEEKGGDVGVQADWNQTDDTQLDYIKNKPTIPTKTSELTNDSDFITNATVPTATVTQTDNGAVVTMIDKNGTTTATVANGASVTVIEVTENTADGGNNVVTFSDGKTLTVKNGRTGTPGTNGKSAYEVARDGGFVGTEEEWLNSLKPEIEQELGTNPETVMSQSATTNALNKRLEKGLNGTVTILADEWVDSTPTEAAINMGEIDDGDLVIITPANDDTFRECSQKHIHINNLALDTESNTLVMLRCNEGLGVPTITLKFDYQILKANFPSGRAVAILSGVDYEAVVYNKLGDSENIPISQKAVTDSLSTKASIVYEDVVDTLVGGAVDEGKSVRTISSETAGANVSSHNTATDSHNDIRLAIQACEEKLNNFLNVNDETKVQLSELLQMIEQAEETTDIEQLTISKVNVSDIIDNLETNDGAKPLSAAQGVVLNSALTTLVGSDVGKSVKEISEEVVKTNTIKNYLLDLFHPVGDVVMNFSADWNPNTIWGGTWIKIENRFLVGARADAEDGDPYFVGSVGGSETVTLTVENLPPHTHFIGDENYTLIGSEGSAESTTSRGIKYTTNGRGSTLRTNQSSGCYNKAFSIIPPYQAVYIWRRTA